MSVARYRKKPVVIEALVWTGENREEARAFLGEHFIRWGEDHTVRVGTLEGPHAADPGDYLIRGVKGEHYPCKPDIFAATYEAVERATPGGMSDPFGDSDTDY